MCNVCVDNKELAIASLDCLESFVTTNGRHFSRLYWDKTVDCLEKIFSATLPQALLMWRSEDTGDPGSPYDVVSCVIVCFYYTLHDAASPSLTSGDFAMWLRRGERCNVRCCMQNCRRIRNVNPAHRQGFVNTVYLAVIDIPEPMASCCIVLQCVVLRDTKTDTQRLYLYFITRFALWLVSLLVFYLSPL